MLFALAALTWATMILGLLAERILAVEEALARTFASTGDTVSDTASRFPRVSFGRVYTSLTRERTFLRFRR